MEYLSSLRLVREYGVNVTVEQQYVMLNGELLFIGETNDDIDKFLLGMLYGIQLQDNKG